MLTQVVPALDSIASPPLLQYSNQEEGEEGGEGTVTFKANQRLLGLYITGRPGSSGWLRVSVLTEGASDHPLVLDIPFKLSPCPFGFVQWRKPNFGSDSKVSAQKLFGSLSHRLDKDIFSLIPSLHCSPPLRTYKSAAYILSFIYAQALKDNISQVSCENGCTQRTTGIQLHLPSIFLPGKTTPLVCENGCSRECEWYYSRAAIIVAGVIGYS